jgi:hypothetical protein
MAFGRIGVPPSERAEYAARAMLERRWIALPCEGGQLIRCRLAGNGKDAELHIAAVGHPVAIVGTHELTITSFGGLGQAVHAVDDLDIEILMEPPPGVRVDICEAKIDISSEDRSVDELFSEWASRKRWEPSAYYAVRLGFASAPSSGAA